MKITFLNFCVSERKRRNDGGEFSFGLSILSAQLKAAGFSPRLIQVVSDYGEEEIGNILDNHKADIYCINVLSHYLPFIRKWIRVIRQQTKAFVVCGGVAVTVNPDEIINIAGVNSICIGEGDEALVELVESLARGRVDYDINNMWFCLPNGSVRRNPVRPLIQDLDSLPHYDVSLFDVANLRNMRLKTPYIPVMVSRGCPFSCHYCSNEALSRIYHRKGKFARFMSPARAIEEIKHVIQEYHKPAVINFADNTFDLSKEWVLTFCELYMRQIGIPFRAMGRPERLDEEICAALKKAGCFRFTIGLENGSERVRYDLLNRPMKNKDILEAMALLHQKAIQITTYNMCGLPSETKEEMLETIKINARGHVDLLVCSIFWPYKGTKLYDITKAYGLLADTVREELQSVYVDTTLNVPSDLREHIVFTAKYFFRLVYIYKELYASSGAIDDLSEAALDAAYLNTDKRIIRNILESVFSPDFESLVYERLEKDLLMNIRC
jgi:anaerobic magnesium-protoporphyrin IX monomethyl ester cyclase